MSLRVEATARSTCRQDNAHVDLEPRLTAIGLQRRTVVETTWWDCIRLAKISNGLRARSDRVYMILSNFETIDSFHPSSFTLDSFRHIPQVDMSLKVPKAGGPDLFKSGYKYMSGLEEAVLRNIQAVGELTEIVRTSFGPNGERAASCELRQQRARFLYCTAQS